MFQDTSNQASSFKNSRKTWKRLSRLVFMNADATLSLTEDAANCESITTVG
jgi:hypothetical protein